MKQIQEINWNNFKAKFNEKEEVAFERLCYLLFCNEFKQKMGIFRYKNQVGIETELIEVDGKWIGFQSKFYETKISDNKSDIKDTIKKTKLQNPKIHKILFYLNQEFSESTKKSKKSPQYKIEIENFAKSYNIEIEWRVPSHFEKQLTLQENLSIAEYFFSLNKGIIDCISELTQHTSTILEPIRCKIEFNQKQIKIDRSDILKQLKTTLDIFSVIILSGEGGAGKTAIIKEFYYKNKHKPFFVFKATEFNVSHINKFFEHYGKLTFNDFLNEFQDEKRKYIVIDSAEKLSDIENPDVFLEFLTTLSRNCWKIIFTTRHSYLDHLEFQFTQIYNLPFQLLNIDNINKSELENLSKQYNFNIPEDKNLMELLYKPFYLNEYLKNYINIRDDTGFLIFKKILWDKQIADIKNTKNNLHIKREECFLEIAKRKAKQGNFFVVMERCDDIASQSLKSDEIIGYDSKYGGYFITHDIYEEWALDKIIEREFHRLTDYETFFQSLGSSLPIRRAFRKWLSDKLSTTPEQVKPMIEDSIFRDEIAKFWRDEIIVSVLLSNYCQVFFELFEKEILENYQNLFKRILFWLRIACKDIDENVLSLLGIQKTDIFVENLFVKPKGLGWECTIGFVHNHKEKIALSNIGIIALILDDWNQKHKKGKTTKQSSEIALYCYQKIIADENGYQYRSNGVNEKLIEIILNGSYEIKNQLKDIFDDIIAQQKANYRDTYYELVNTILSSVITSCEIAQYLPEQVIGLAELFWFEKLSDNEIYSYRGCDIEQHFCIRARTNNNYLPASSLQTPIFQLLRFHPAKTIDFILSFTNKTIECYAKSQLQHEVSEVMVFYDKRTTIKQYLSDRIWNMYRGTEGSPYLLESIHMALEKWLLQYANTASKSDLEKQCKYLIRHSISASITSVVVSITLAYPEKLFNVAKILFRTKEFFRHDAQRNRLDQRQKSGLLSLQNNFPNYRTKIHDEERIKSCDEPHRKWSLESLAVKYQFIKEESKYFRKRQKEIWEIWDNYYREIPEESQQSSADKTWRLFLARMDTRKMQGHAKKCGTDKIEISLIPDELDPKLKEYSEKSLEKASEGMQYMPLKIWAESRFKRETQVYEKYLQYESNPQLALSQTKEIVETLNSGVKGNFLLFNASIPAYNCSVLIRDFINILNEEDKNFCAGIICEFSTIPIQVERYIYQVSDGVEPCIVTLSLLMEYFPDNSENIKCLLFSLLLSPIYEISTFATNSILQNLWTLKFAHAQSLFIGYLQLKPKYEELRHEIRREKKVYDIPEVEVLQQFSERYEQEIEKLSKNTITYDFKKIEELPLETLKTAFELLPFQINNEDHKRFMAKACSIFSQKLFVNLDRDQFGLKSRFLEKFAYLVLNSKKGEIENYLKPFIINFNKSKDMSSFFQAFISMEDRLNKYEEFWTVWNAFYDKVIEIVKEDNYYEITELVSHYLLAWDYWKQDAKEWHSLKSREKQFFKKVLNDIGDHPAVLYSLSKILNSIASNFSEESICEKAILKRDIMCIDK